MGANKVNIIEVWIFNSDGELISRVFISQEEFDQRSDATLIPPPEETADLKAVFNGTVWELKPRYPPPEK